MAKPFRRALCWIRRDLRTTDHAALAASTAEADAVVVVFVFDRVILDALKDRDDRRITFIHRSLEEVDAELAKQGSKLVVVHGDPVTEIPRLAALVQAEAVFTARDSDPYAIQRDHEVAKGLVSAGRKFKTVRDVTIFEKGEIRGKTGAPLRVYTPYSKVWRARFAAEHDLASWNPDFSCLMPVSELAEVGESWSMADIGFLPAELWLEPGQSGAQARLRAFSKKIGRYKAERDFLAADATSGLSVHLRFGTISIRELMRECLQHDTASADKWFAELIWREFYHDILANNPEVIRTPFQSIYADIEYPGDPANFALWCEGQTGFPVIDAAMRCLNQTGWMHNRLRMVVASFLTKDLLLDYRLGEAYFAQKLLDFELASNNGGWQWAASVGCDPQPYFRIFNPMMQSQRFDPEGKFIREWLPELAQLSNEAIHAPWETGSIDLELAGVRLGDNYPHPIVNHHVQRDLAIALLKGYGKDSV